MDRDVDSDAVIDAIVDGFIAPAGVVLPDGRLLLDDGGLRAVGKDGVAGDDDDFALGAREGHVEAAHVVEEGFVAGQGGRMRLGGADQHDLALAALEALDRIDSGEGATGRQDGRRRGRHDGPQGVTDGGALHPMGHNDAVTGVAVIAFWDELAEDVDDEGDLEWIAGVAAVFVVGDEDHGGGGVEDGLQERIEGQNRGNPGRDGGVVGDAVTVVDDGLQKICDGCGHAP